MSGTGTNGARSIKRTRRKRDDIDRIRTALYEIIEEHKPVTLRQAFYLAVSSGIVGKSESEYHRTVGRLLTEMRLTGKMPFSWMVDSTRWMRKPDSYDSLADALDQTKHFYRRALWQNQTSYVECWSEKDTLAGVLYPVTSEYDVPLMVTRGYPSLSYLHTAAAAIKAQEKPTFIYYFGDHDPSGLDIERSIQDRLAEFGADVTFQRIAVTKKQIQRLRLATRPTKKTDSRSKQFQGESVEVDAIPPQTLRDLLSHMIKLHIDQAALDVLRVAEQSEREILTRLVETQSGSEPSA